jgi:hypothetical protein
MELTDRQLAEQLVAAVDAGDDEQTVLVENTIADRIGLDLDHTEQGLTLLAVRKIETFVSKQLGRQWLYVDSIQSGPTWDVYRL